MKIFFFLILNIRTKNGPLSFYSTFNGQFYAGHYLVPAVISVLTQMQVEAFDRPK